MISHARRIANKNPLHPYSWIARYRDGGRLKQFDFDGYHYGHDIDLRRVQSIEICGHPNSPIFVPILDDSDGQRPDEVLLIAHNAIDMELGSNKVTYRIPYYFIGYRYGQDVVGAKILEDGKIIQVTPLGETEL